MTFNNYFKKKKVRDNKRTFLNKLSLNNKMFLYFIIQIIAVILIVIVFSQRMITENIVKLEKNKVNQNISRIVNTLDKELEYIKKTCKDYSNWNKTYEYINLKEQNKDQEYTKEFEKENFDTVNMSNLELNAIMILDNNGKILFESFYDKEYLNNYNIPDNIRNTILKNDVLDSVTNIKAKNGILTTDKGLYFVSMYPILRNNSLGNKAGVMVMAKEVKQEILEETVPKFSIFEADINIDLLDSSIVNTKNLGEVKTNIILHLAYTPSLDASAYIKDFTDSKLIITKLNSDEGLIENIKITRNLFLGILVLYITIIMSTWKFLNNSFMSKIEAIHKSITKLKKGHFNEKYKELDTHDELEIVETQIDTLVNELNNHYEEIIIKSNTDELTGLYNRVGFNKELEKFKNEFGEKYSKAALLFLDIDKFKNINDIYSHKVGDLILIEFAHRVFKNAIPNTIVARTSGDEFVILVKEYKDKDEIRNFAAKLVKLMREPFELGGYSIKTTVSIGVAFYSDGNCNINNMMIQGDLAMYNVKKNGRNNFIEYTSDMKKLITGISITEGIKYKELYMVYQPQINPTNGNIEGMESLVRWKSKLLGFVPPNEFINIAEETGAIHELGEFIIEEVFKQMEIWEKKQFNIPKVSINISPIQLMNKNFCNYVKEMLNKYNISTNKIVFEITENFAIENQKQISDNLNIINKAGIDIYLDDFGKGYSALSYLEKLPIRGVKIDKKFVDYICQNDKIIKMIFTLAQSLNLKVVAEGVENEAQKEIIQQMGECVIQGYLYSKPLSVKELEDKYL